MADTTETLSPWYVTGFADGEGIFTYNYGRGRLTLSVVFAIRLAATDRALLESIRHFFGGAGRLYESRKRPPGRHTGWSKSSCYYKTTSPAQLLRVVDHFENYPLQGEKRRVYEIWREMVVLKAAYLGSRIPEELHSLAEELSRVVPRNRPWI